MQIFVSYFGRNLHARQYKGRLEVPGLTLFNGYAEVMLDDVSDVYGFVLFCVVLF
jgi:hypothetical protein